MVDAAKRYGMEGNYVAGANIAGFEKVVNAMLAQEYANYPITNLINIINRAAKPHGWQLFCFFISRRGKICIGNLVRWHQIFMSKMKNVYST